MCALAAAGDRGDGKWSRQRDLTGGARARAAAARPSAAGHSFSIWNTMIGSSLLSMPYAINQAGWVLGIFIMLLMCAICLYCCLLILEHDQGNGACGCATGPTLVRAQPHDHVRCTTS